MNTKIKISLSAIILSSIIIVESCRNDDRKLAEVYGNVLYESELHLDDYDDLPEKEASNLKKIFINQWIKEQLLLHRVKLAGVDQDKIETLTSKYKKSLILEYSKNSIIKEKLDSSVSEEDMENYYNTVKSKFKSKENIINYKLLKVKKDNPNLDKIKKFWASKSLDSLSNMPFSEDEIAEVGDEHWAYEGTIKTLLPGPILKNGLKSIDNQKNDNYIYFFKILDNKKKDEILPLQFIKDQITSLILNKRKSSIIDNYVTNIYNKELKRIKIYDLPEDK